MKFYDYNSKTFQKFFKNIGEKKNSPISVWEYIIIRSQFMLDMDNVINIIYQNNLKVDNKNKEKIIKILNNESKLINEIKYFMNNKKIINSMSYMIIDFDWNKL